MLEDRYRKKKKMIKSNIIPFIFIEIITIQFEIYSIRIEKLKGINVKLRTKLKELNSLLEKTLEKANTRKLYKMN